MNKRNAPMNDDAGEPESTVPVKAPDPNAAALAKFYDAEAGKARTRIKQLSAQLDKTLANVRARGKARKVQYLQTLADGILERIQDEDAIGVRAGRKGAG